MAGLTKEQRIIKQAEEKRKLEESIRVELEKQYAEKLKEEKSKLLCADSLEKSEKKKSKVEIPSNTIIPVKSGVHGILTYSSKKTYGYIVDWDDYGSVEFLEYGELLSMRNTQRSFFENNWIFIEDTEDFTAEEIYRALAIDKFYSNIITGNDLDALFVMSPDDIKKTVSILSNGVKQNIAAVAKSKIESGEFDSINRIKALEQSLNLVFSPSY